MNTVPQTVVIADDHPLFRDAIKQALVEHSGAQSVAIRCLDASDLNSLDKILETTGDIDLVLMDLHMPGIEGFAGLMYINRKYPQVPVAMISANEDPQIMRRAVEHGATGFIPKSASIDTILAAIEAIYQGNIWLPDTLEDGSTPDSESANKADMSKRLAQLTPQQLKVLGMIAKGLSNKSIAVELGLAEATIKVHVTAIMRKLGVTNRTQAVLVAKHLDVKPAYKASDSTPDISSPIESV